MKPYPLAEELVRPVLRVRMPRAPRMVALPHFVRNLRPEGTMYMVARCNNREFYALGTPNRITTLHPSYLALSPDAKVRQRQYRTLLAPSADPQADTRDPRWSTQRAVGTAAFVAQYTPRKGRRRIVSVPAQIQALGA